MALSEDEEKWLDEFILAADNHPRVSAWEQGFIADQHTRLTDHGPDMFLSPKQWAVLRRIADKIGHDTSDIEGAGE